MSKISSRSWEVRDLIRGRERFETHGALRGAPFSGQYLHTGQLPQEWAQRLLDDAPNVSYVVWSYATPIAWYVEDKGWYVPDVRYSVTTSRHQTIVRVSAPGYVEL